SSSCFCVFFSSRRRHTRCYRDWSSDVLLFRSRRHFPNLSAATLRNVMADLEEMGYLVQPHTSAGRVPTDKAYRFYVESFPPPSSSEERRVGKECRSLWRGGQYIRDACQWQEQQ